uniref:Magnesium transporter n=1 Tax=Heterorhabditis bacteriophora TaxID=37862 RepID=A0A1I7WMS8_HETBA
MSYSGDSSSVPQDPHPHAAPPNPAVENELTEEDLFRMKSLVPTSAERVFSILYFSKESQEDVINTINITQPDLVMVELCPSRISILSMDEQTLLREASDLNSQKIITTIKQVNR